MPLTRRDFSALLPMLAAPSAWWRASVQAPSPFDWGTVTPRVRSCTGLGGNVMLVTDGGSSLLVDTKSFGLGGALRRDVERLGGRLRWVVLTHHHFDHAGGAATFADIPSLGHENARGRTETRARETIAELRKDGAAYVAGYLDSLREFGEVRVDAQTRAELDGFARNPETVDPTHFGPSEFVERTRVVRVGGIDVEVHHIGPGHTDNDVFLYLPSERVLHTGDLLFHGFHPFIDAQAGATTTGWERSIAAMLARSDARALVVPGHGVVTDVRALETQRDYFRRLRDVVGDGIRAGRTRAEMTGTAVPAFAGLGWGEGLGANLGVVYDELRGR